MPRKGGWTPKRGTGLREALARGARHVNTADHGFVLARVLRDRSGRMRFLVNMENDLYLSSPGGLEFGKLTHMSQEKFQDKFQDALREVLKEALPAGKVPASGASSEAKEAPKGLFRRLFRRRAK